MNNFYAEILKSIYNVNQGTDSVTYTYDSDDYAVRQKYISAFDYLEEKGYLVIEYSGPMYSLHLTAKGIDYISSKL